MATFKRPAAKTMRNFLSSNLFLALFAAGLIAISVFLWQRQEARNLAHIVASTESQARFYASEAEIRYTSINDALERLASRGEPDNDIDTDEWQKDAAFYLNAFTGLESIAWVDESFRIRHAVPKQPGIDSIGKQVNQLDSRPDDVNLWVPVYDATEFKGYIFGIVSIDSFIAPVTREIRGDYMLRLVDEGLTIFESEDWVQPEEGFAVDKWISLENTTVFNLTFAPTGQLLGDGIRNARGTLFFSLFFSFIAVVAVYFAQNYNAIAILNELRYRNLFNASRDAIFIINMKGAYVDANPTATELVGYSVAELQTMTMDDLRENPDRMPPNVRTWLWAEGGVMEMSLRHKAGHTVPVEMMISPIIENRAQTSVLGSARDITERLQAEQDLAKYRDHLEELVEKRTAELEKSNQELAEFAYFVSHDLKAPLRGIIQLSNWITDDYAGVLDDDGRELLRLLNHRTVRMNDLIMGIMQYSRIGRVKEKEIPVNLQQLVAGIIDALALPAHIRITIMDNLPTVTAEPTRLEQVFQNLLENAVKNMDKAEGLISVTYADDGDVWHFSVCDNGPGIDQKYFVKIFQMFQTLSPHDQAESTGVGLALVKKIVESWGGRVWVESRLGSGSSFHFTVPKFGQLPEGDHNEGQQTDSAG
jgi:two-component system sensor kinase FixL